MTSLRLASTTADLIMPYPFGSGIEAQIPILPGGIYVPVPFLIPNSNQWRMGDDLMGHRLPHRLTERTESQSSSHSHPLPQRAKEGLENHTTYVYPFCRKIETGLLFLLRSIVLSFTINHSGTVPGIGCNAIDNWGWILFLFFMLPSLPSLSKTIVGSNQLPLPS